MTEEQGREEGGAVVSAPVARPRRRWRGIAAAGVVAVAGTLAVVALHRPATDDSRYAVMEQEAPPAAQAADPLRAELIRCGALPPQSDDRTCRAAWDESRRRFFGERRAAPVLPQSIEPGSSTALPAVPSAPATER